MNTTPQKDCLNCRRRRIRCDRSVPACHKCESRSLECPGYGIDIRWKQEPGPRNRDQQGRATPTESSSSTASTPGIAMLRQQIYTDSAAAQQYEHPLASESDPQSHRLLQHYTEMVAPQLAWIDGQSNLYRGPILQIALENPAVRSSMFALSAADRQRHLDQQSQEHEELSRSVDGYQTEAMGLISSDMKRLAEEGETFVTNDPNQARFMLVSLCLLIMMGLRLDDESVWRLHMRTADVLLQAWLCARGPSALAELSFETRLIHMICDCQVWCSLTRAAVLVDKRRCFNLVADAPLSGMAVVIHSITEHERHVSQIHGHRATEPLDAFTGELEDARFRASQHYEAYDCQPREDLEKLNEMFYQATLIYLYRVCLSHAAASAAIVLPQRRLIDALRRTEDTTMISHHLMWPIFVAGTESDRDIENQSLVELKMNEVMRASGRLGRPKVMAFLREFWGWRTQSSRVRWIDMAKEWEDRGKAITIF